MPHAVGIQAGFHFRHTRQQGLAVIIICRYVFSSSIFFGQKHLRAGKS